MSLRTWLPVAFVLLSGVLEVLGNTTMKNIEVQEIPDFPITRINALQKMKNLQKKVDEFYDALRTSDYDIDQRLNSSTLSELDNLLSLKMQQLNRFQKYRELKLSIKTQQLETSCSRMRSSHRSNNVVVLGLRFSRDWDDVYMQLNYLVQHLGLEFDERYLKDIKQNRLLLKPTQSRVLLTFKKIQTKQMYLLKFKLALEKFEKTILEKNINYRTRKLGNIPHLMDCQIYMQDDMEKTDKILFGELKKLQRSYPRFIHCYLKDSRVFYKLSNKARPSTLDRMEEINVLRKTLQAIKAASVNDSLQLHSGRSKSYRSGTVFPWEVYQFNRTRLQNFLRNSSQVPVSLCPVS